MAQTATEQLTSQRASSADVVIPIFASLPHLGSKTGPFLDRVRQDLIERELPHVDRDDLWTLISAKICNGKARLLLDGWDEATTVKNDLAHELRKFLKFNNNCRFVLGSRDVGYEPLQINARQLRLLPLSRPLRNRFVNKYFDGRAARERAIVRKLKSYLRDDGVVPLAGIPLMLAIMCRFAAMTQGNVAALPTSQQGFYEICVRSLVEEWKADEVDVHRNPRKLGTQEARDNASRDIAGAAHLAARMNETGKGYVLSPEEMGEIMLDGEIGGEREEKLRELASSRQRLIDHGLLVQESPGPGNRRLRFLLPAIHDYLAFRWYNGNLG